MLESPSKVIAMAVLIVLVMAYSSVAVAGLLIRRTDAAVELLFV
jgi:hypothetical protein